MKPLTDRIFIRLENKYEKTPLIFKPFSLDKQRANIGVVEEVGQLVTSVKKGDKVMFHPFDELETPDEDIVVIREKSLLAILN